MARAAAPPALLFADGFGATAIDARGKVRARALPGPCLAFDAKAARLAVLGAGGGLTLLDAALRSERAACHAPGALLPDGAPVHLRRREGALGLDRGDATSWRALPATGEALEVSLHPEVPTGEFGLFAQMSLWSDGGDLGTLAHCVQGAASDWGKWSEPPGGQGLLSTGGSVTAAREADARELLAALDALDAHGVPLRASAFHWATMHHTPGARAFDHEAGALFARLLVDPTLRVGAQGACARALLAEPFDVARWQHHRAACAQTPEGMVLAQLSRAVMERHIAPGALPPEAPLVR